MDNLIHEKTTLKEWRNTSSCKEEADMILQHFLTGRLTHRKRLVYSIRLVHLECSLSIWNWCTIVSVFSKYQHGFEFWCNIPHESLKRKFLLHNLYEIYMRSSIKFNMMLFLNAVVNYKYIKQNYMYIFFSSHNKKFY